MFVPNMLEHELLATSIQVKENDSATAICGQFSQLCGDGCMGARIVRREVKHFGNGNMDIADQSCCGRLRSTMTGHNEKKVDALISEDGTL